MLIKMRRVFKRVLSYFPEPLPVGMAQFNAWANDIIELSGKYANETSLRFALATMIMHADAKFGSLSKNYFVIRLRKVAANQVAGQVFQDIKDKQAADQAAQVKTVEDTTIQTVASDVKPS